MNIHSVIASAIEYESRVYRVYVDASEKVRNPHAKRILKHLADEEEYHLKYLKDILQRLETDENPVFEQLKSMNPDKEEIEQSLMKLKKYFNQVKPNVVDQEREENILEKALSMERETYDFYRRLSKEMDGKFKKIFDRFLEIEEGHLAIVQAELDAVTGMGFWFDWQEFDLEAG